MSKHSHARLTVKTREEGKWKVVPEVQLTVTDADGTEHEIPNDVIARVEFVYNAKSFPTAVVTLYADADLESVGVEITTQARSKQEEVPE